MADTITFTPQTRSAVKKQTVYARRRWSDPWTKIPWLFADQLSWTAAPTIPSAKLTWDYGFLQRQGELLPGVVTRLLGYHRWWIKVVVEVQPQKVGSTSVTAPLVWYGTLEVEQDQLGGVKRIVKSGATYDVRTGQQSLVAYGLAYTLSRSYLRHAVWRDASGVEQRIERPIWFNAPDATGKLQGNRSATKGARAYRFTHGLRVGDSLWSTRTIAEYLCAEGGLKDRDGNETIPLYLDAATQTALPDWDSPTIRHTFDESVWGLFNQTIDRGRLLGFYLDVSGTSLNEDWTIFPFTHLASNLALTDVDGEGASGSIPKNARQRTIESDGSPDVHVDVKDSAIPQVDRVICLGRRRTSTFTISEPDKTLEIGWPAALTTAYDAGNSGAGVAYDNLKLDEKRKANAESRSADRLRSAYRLLRIPESWADGREDKLLVRDGLASGDYRPVFPLEGEEDASGSPTLMKDKAFPVYAPELHLLRTLPLKDGYDYTTRSAFGKKIAATRVSEGPHNELPPLCLFRVPEDTTTATTDGTRHWVNGEQIARAAEAVKTTAAVNRRLSVRVEIPKNDRALELEVGGAPQHAIFDEFTPLPVDRDTYGGFDWKKAVYTVAALDDRFCEAQWPEKTSIDAALEDVRELIVELGDEYRRDWLVPNTVVGVDPATCLLKRSIEGGWINDDRPLLKARAKVIYEYYRQRRRSLSLATSWVNSALQIGDYIVKLAGLDERTIDSVVTSISLQFPSGRNPSAPVISYETSHVELEAFRGGRR